MTRRVGLLVLLSVLVGLVVASTGAASGKRGFPSVIPLPNGFQPEGIAAGRGPVLFAGSLADGSIYRADARTGEGEILVPGTTGRVAVGLAFDPRTGYLFVAGGQTGMAHVYDTRTGDEVASYQLTAPGTFVNDVVVTKRGAYFTDSFQPVLFVLPLSPGGGLPAVSESLPLGGDWTQVASFNANGIEATPNGRALIVVNSALGTLYAVDPDTGVASEIDLGGGSVSSGDGLLLHGKTLFVARNFLNAIAVVKLAPDLGSGAVVDEITDPDFRIPTTLARLGRSLYAVNARFDVTPPTPDTEYEIVRVDGV